MDGLLEIGRTLIGLGAPIIGNAIGGPLGSAAGKILASALGANGANIGGGTAAEIKVALEQLDPAARDKALAEAEAEWARTIAEESKTMRVVVRELNETSRIELGSDDKFVLRARPSVLWVFSALSLMFGTILTISIGAIVYRFSAADIATALTALVGMISSLAMLLGVIAFPATGYVWSRGREKQIAMGAQAPGLLETVAGSFKRK